MCARERVCVYVCVYQQPVLASSHDASTLLHRDLQPDPVDPKMLHVRPLAHFPPLQTSIQSSALTPEAWRPQVLSLLGRGHFPAPTPHPPTCVSHTCCSILKSLALGGGCACRKILSVRLRRTEFTGAGLAHLLSERPMRVKKHRKGSKQAKQEEEVQEEEDTEDGRQQQDMEQQMQSKLQRFSSKYGALAHTMSAHVVVVFLLMQRLHGLPRSHFALLS